jgi:O-antigen/teichoic acid export membrane protein
LKKKARAWLTRAKVFLPDKSFLESAALLGGATAIGQAISILSSLILTRLYTPSDFGALAVFVSILSQLLVVSSFRYEWAIPLEEDESSAIDLLFLCFLLTSLNFVFSCTVIYLFGDQLAVLANIPNLKPFLWLLPPTLLISGAYQSLSYWVLRRKAFKILAISKLEQSLWGAVTPIALGLASKGPMGLLIGYSLNLSMAIRKLVSFLLSNRYLYLGSPSFFRMKKMARKYYRFPTFSVFSSFLNNAGLICPVLFMNFFYTSDDSGSFSLAQRLVSIPGSLIGASIAQAFIPNATKLVQENPKELKNLYYRATLFLFIAGGLFTLILLFSPSIFTYVFGLKWYQSGLMAQSMVLMFIPFLIASPLCLLEWLNRQDWMLGWNITRLVLLSVGFMFSHYFNKSSVFAVVVSSSVMGSMYLLLVFANIYFLNIRIDQHSKEVKIFQ